jgi:hypothetical protein
MRESDEMLYSYLVNGRNYTHQSTFDSCSRCDQPEWGAAYEWVSQPRRMAYRGRVRSCRMGDLQPACAKHRLRITADDVQRSYFSCSGVVECFLDRRCKR